MRVMCIVVCRVMHRVRSEKNRNKVLDCYQLFLFLWIKYDMLFLYIRFFVIIV